MAKGINEIIKMAQQMQAKMEEVQKDLENQRVEGSAGGGMVKVIANGKQEILNIQIEPEVINPGEKAMLEELIVAAVNQARQRAQELASEQMLKLTGGIKIPGLSF